MDDAAMTGATEFEGLTERAGNDVDTPHDVTVFVGAAPRLAEEARGMAVVYHRQGIGLLGERADLPQIGNSAVHREHTVGHDQPRIGARRIRELLAEVLHVVVRVTESLRFGQADTVDDAGVVQRVTDDRIFGTEYGLEQAAIRVEARRIEDGILGAEKGADARLEFLVDGLGAADEAHRCHAVTEFIECLVRGRNDLGMIGETQVVVGAEVQHVLAAAVRAHVDVGLLRAADQALGLEQALLAERVRLLG